MTESKQDTERTYDAPSADGTAWLPDLTRVDGIAAVVDGGTRERDAVYYDTDDLRLAGASAALWRGAGEADAGWHLGLPLPGNGREEIHAPLSDTVPDALRDLARSRTRGAPLRPVVRVRAARRVHRLVGPGGRDLAELSVDAVGAESLHGTGTKARWAELAVTLADGAGPGLLDAVDKALRDSGIERANSASPLARALTETGAGTPRPPSGGRAAVPGSAGEAVLRQVAEQVGALVELDPAVRRDVPDAVHRMRVACRRLRAVLRSYRTVVDRKAADPVRAELKWLGGELAAERDHEVLLERLDTRLAALPPELRFGPVAARLQVWDAATGADARRRTLDALDSPRYLALLNSLAALTHHPPLRAKASRKPQSVMADAVLKEYARLAARVTHALGLPPGADRDRALHEARKAAKRTRYATEPARPSLGKPAKRLGKRIKAVQKVLGDHQDSVVARATLRDLAVAAHTAGETGFVWGLLYGQEQATAEARERDLPAAWRAASRRRLRKALNR
ncbi:CYTH and CHAD domain-containing protein [Streptomyces niveiscabiei]|uniref:CYTH and CHAD domain-containing protein n=1 Tax=Streptomyces niveiscabiei TaxID=164115 RepID=UPI0029BF1F80|nr:CYTH and CHAD domain-containing protein [Streptomyces niveiscabiei]MDX3380483.1 CYTH and CHAD domain-containing protein [Streptomyces niveiscabiei]